MASTSDSAKSAREKAYGKKTVYVDKPFKAEGSNKKVSTPDLKKAKALKKQGKATIQNISKKEAYKNFESTRPAKTMAKAKYSNVDSDAYDLLMKRAQNAGLTPAQTKKAISQALKATARQMGSERSRTATRATGIEKREAKKKINKFMSGY